MEGGVGVDELVVRPTTPFRPACFRCSRSSLMAAMNSSGMALLMFRSLSALKLVTMVSLPVSNSRVHVFMSPRFVVTMWRSRRPEGSIMCSMRLTLSWRNKK